MDSDIVDRLHALVEDSIDDVYPVPNPVTFNSYFAPSHFESLFASSINVHGSPMNELNDFHMNNDYSTGDCEVPGKKLINHENRVAVKILIPAASVGPLIGKGGFFMRTLQHECYVNICPRDLQYAGTTDRVVILKGRLGSVLNVTERITSHVKERCPKAKRHDVFSLEEPGKGYEIRFVVPNSSAEILYSDNSLTEIREFTGCYVQLYPNLLSLEDGTIVNERLIVVAHDSVSHAKQAVEMILEAVSNDPYHISEISKLDHQFLRNNQRRSSVPGTSSPVMDPSFAFPASPGSSNTLWNTMDNADTAKNYITSFMTILRAIHTPEHVISEVINAVKVIANRGVLELAVSVGMQNFGLITGAQPTPPNSTGNNHSYVMFLPEEQDNVEIPGEHISVNRTVLEVLMNDSGALSDGTNYASTVIEEQVFPDYVQLKIPERIVGAVIGPKAKMLTDIQHFSRCRVQMERKDPNSSPDGLRLLNLYGDAASVKKCRALMERLINEEYRRRAARIMV